VFQVAGSRATGAGPHQRPALPLQIHSFQRCPPTSAYDEGCYPYVGAFAHVLRETRYGRKIRANYEVGGVYGGAQWGKQEGGGGAHHRTALVDRACKEGVGWGKKGEKGGETGRVYGRLLEPQGGLQCSTEVFKKQRY
jgi:hypothetical protein